MNNISQRVSDLRDALNLSQQLFADRIGFSRNYVSRVELGKNDPSRRFVSAVEILEKEAKAIASRGASTNEHSATYGAVSTRRKFESNVDPTPIKVRMIPVFSLIQAGQATAYEALPDSWDDVIAYDGPDEEVFALRVAGDSMEPKFSAGMIITMSTRYPPNNGDLVAACIRNEGALFKIFHHSGDNLKVTLTSYNSAFPPLVFDRAQFHWIYKVVRITQKL